MLLKLLQILLPASLMESQNFIVLAYHQLLVQLNTNTGTSGYVWVLSSCDAENATFLIM